jgi:hypothetical protein
MSISIPIIDGIFRVIEKVIPDPAAKAQAQLKALEMQQAGEFKEIEANLQLALAQIDVNKVEAAAPDLFRGGWRPAVGWVCVIGLLYTYLGQPLLAWASGIWEVPAPPSLDLGDLLILLGGMLGLGGMRTMERLKGKA